MGLTIWGLIAFGLLVVFCLVGYRAVVKIHGSGVSVVDTHESSRESAGGATASRSDSVPVTGATPAATRPAPTMDPLTADTTHAMLRNAARQHRYDMAVEYGSELFDAGNAGPDDLVIVAQSHYALSDCASA